jgi:hypothetical protein
MPARESLNLRFGLHAADAAQPLSAWDEVERHWPPSAVPSAAWDEVERHWPPSAVPSAVPRAAAAAEPALAATRCAPAPPSGLSTNFLERSVAAPSRSPAVLRTL